jgi:hypothetical protein
MMSMSAGTELGRAELIDYIKATVDVFVQLGQEDGARLVTEIQFNHRVKPSAAGPETVGI